jgi:hypothetical protein
VKRILLITGDDIHRQVYERWLKKSFVVEYSDSTDGAPDEVDAVVYDLPGEGTPRDLEWMEALTVPIVVLSPTEWSRAPVAASRRILVYPVKLNQILRALAALGVDAEDGKRW